MQPELIEMVKRSEEDAGSSLISALYTFLTHKRACVHLHHSFIHSSTHSFIHSCIVCSTSSSLTLSPPHSVCIHTHSLIHSFLSLACSMRTPKKSSKKKNLPAHMRPTGRGVCDICICMCVCVCVCVICSYCTWYTLT